MLNDESLQSTHYHLIFDLGSRLNTWMFVVIVKLASFKALIAVNHQVEFCYFR